MMKTLLLAILLFNVLSAAEKKRDWQTGTVRDSSSESSFSGMSSTTTGGPQSGPGYHLPSYGPAVTSSTARYAVFQTYVIEAEKYVYVASERVRWRWSRPASLIVNTPVQFAIEKRKLFLLDDEGKVHEAAIEKIIAKP